LINLEEQVAQLKYQLDQKDKKISEYKETMGNLNNMVNDYKMK
jgi:hypothetical protein